MNLNAYDDASNKIDKQRSWVDINKKQLITREIKYRLYYSLVKRYDKKTNVVSFFIAMLDEPSPYRVCYRTRKDDYGRLKFRLFPIWNETSLDSLETNCNVIVEHIESQSDGDIYYIDV